jgi:branched-chain amino acid transport system ATP-binding protein
MNSQDAGNAPDTPRLEVRDVVMRFGGIVALDHVSFDMPTGKIAGLIGPNGAGKTTLFNCLSRRYAPSSGSILLAERSILDGPAHPIAGLGIGHTFQNLALFLGLSVIDNVRIGGHTIGQGGGTQLRTQDRPGHAAAGTGQSRTALRHLGTEVA